MGLFDYITCKFPLPVKGANELRYQTKDTPTQFLDNYEIREDGTLWHEIYDIEDHSEVTKWQKANPNKELPENLNKWWKKLYGCMVRVNQCWKQVLDFMGEIRFYTFDNKAWIEWSAYFENGKLTRINLVKHEINDDIQNKSKLDDLFKKIDEARLYDT